MLCRNVFSCFTKVYSNLSGYMVIHKLSIGMVNIKCTKWQNDIRLCKVTLNVPVIFSYIAKELLARQFSQNFLSENAPGSKIFLVFLKLF